MQMLMLLHYGWIRFLPPDPFNTRWHEHAQPLSFRVLLSPSWPNRQRPFSFVLHTRVAKKNGWCLNIKKWDISCHDDLSVCYNLSDFFTIVCFEWPKKMKNVNVTVCVNCTVNSEWSDLGLHSKKISQTKFCTV